MALTCSLSILTTPVSIDTCYVLKVRLVHRDQSQVCHFILNIDLDCESLEFDCLRTERFCAPSLSPSQKDP